MYANDIDLGIATAADYERMVQRLLLERQALAASRTEESAHRAEHKSGHFGWIPKLHRSA